MFYKVTDELSGEILHINESDIKRIESHTKGEKGGYIKVTGRKMLIPINREDYAFLVSHLEDNRRLFRSIQ